MKKLLNNFDTIKHKKNFKRVYPSDMWKFFDKHKDSVFTVIDSGGDITHHLHRHITDFFIKHNLKNGYFNKEKGVLYVETYNQRYGSITDKYVVINKKLRLE